MVPRLRGGDLRDVIDLRMACRAISVCSSRMRLGRDFADQTISVRGDFLLIHEKRKPCRIHYK